MEQELKEQVNQILQKNLDEVYFSVAEKILNDHPKSRYLPWMLAHKMSPEEARVIDALPDKDWTPEVGELKVSKSFAEKLGMDKYEIDAQIMDRFFSADVMSDPEQGPVIRPDPARCGGSAMDMRIILYSSCFWKMNWLRGWRLRRKQPKSEILTG